MIGQFRLWKDMNQYIVAQLKTDSSALILLIVLLIQTLETNDPRHWLCCFEIQSREEPDDQRFPINFYLIIKRSMIIHPNSLAVSVHKLGAWALCIKSSFRHAIEILVFNHNTEKQIYYYKAQYLSTNKCHIMSLRLSLSIFAGNKKRNKINKLSKRNCTFPTLPDEFIYSIPANFLPGISWNLSSKNNM